MKQLKFILCMFFLVCLSCQNEMDTDSDVSILGKWKLIKSTGFGEEVDYSGYNIVYEFNSKGIVNVSGVPEIIESIENGERSYCYSIVEIDDELKPTVISGLLDYDENCNNSFQLWFLISSKSKSIEMKSGITNPLIDGSILNFIKIK